MKLISNNWLQNVFLYFQYIFNSSLSNQENNKNKMNDLNLKAICVKKTVVKRSDGQRQHIFPGILINIIKFELENKRITFKIIDYNILHPNDYIYYGLNDECFNLIDNNDTWLFLITIKNEEKRIVFLKNCHRLLSVFKIGSIVKVKALESGFIGTFICCIKYIGSVLGMPGHYFGLHILVICL